MANDEKYYDPSELEPIPERDEGPPPLTRTMAGIRWAILTGLSVFALIMILNAVGLSPWQAQASDEIQYHCPMHPTYVSSQPGDCPICGMSLVPIDSKGKELKQEDTKSKSDSKAAAKIEKADTMMAGMTYTCPMHPEVTSSKPGECPKCGMDLVVAKGSSDSTAVTYACPMHPEITSGEPGECSKCGMDLVMISDTTSTIMHEGHDKMNTPSETDAKYSCPMHPEVTSSEPGRCPKCNMFLEPIKKESSDRKSDDKSEMAPAMNHEGHTSSMTPNDLKDQELARHSTGGSVPGLVPVAIEANRLQLIGITTAKAEMKSLVSGIRIAGFVTPDESKINNVNIRFSGWVMNLFVDQTGQFVEAGDPLMSIYSQDLYQAEQDFMVARDSYRNSSGDSALTYMRQKIYSAARERLKLLGLANEQVDEIEKTDLPSPQLIIKSPNSGYVLTKSVLPGQYLTPNQNLLTIVDLNNIWVIGDVYEQDIPNIAKGLKAVMTLDSYPGEKFEGRIGFIYPSISTQTRTLKVRVEFPNKNLRLRPGMYADVELQGKGNKVLAISREALLDNGDIRYAFVVHDSTHFVPRKVELGRSNDEWVEVRSGIENGETVVTSANFLIDSESRLQAAIAGMAGTSDEESTKPMPQGHVH